MRNHWGPSRMYLAAIISALLFTSGSAWLPHNSGLTRRALPRSAAVQLAVPSTMKMSASESPVQDYSVVLLAGGVGSRMKANMPKQFLQLRGKTVLMHSIELFLNLDGVREVRHCNTRRMYSTCALLAEVYRLINCSDDPNRGIRRLTSSFILNIGF